MRPVKYYQGVPSPVKHPERMDVVIFRENTEDVYAGIEWEQGTPEAAKLIEFLNKDMLKGGKKQVRLDSGVGIKPISITGTKRLVRMAIKFALRERTQERHPGAQGQHPEVHRGRLPQVGLRTGDRGVPRQSRDRARELDPGQQGQEPNLTIEQNAALVEPGLEFATEDFRKSVYAEVKDVLDAIYATHGKGAWKKKLMINDRIADSIFQQVVTRADEYSVLATSQPERRLHLRRLRRAGRRAGHRARRQHRRRLRDASKRRTAPRRSTPTRTSSIPARSFSPA